MTTYITNNYYFLGTTPAKALLPTPTIDRGYPPIELREGEVYAGVVRNLETNLPSHHLVLLLGEIRGDFYTAYHWAEKSVRELPTRQELVLLHDKLKVFFKEEYYWSCEETAPGYAWAKGLNKELPCYVPTVSTCLAILVRRVLI